MTNLWGLGLPRPPSSEEEDLATEEGGVDPPPPLYCGKISTQGLYPLVCVCVRVYVY